MGPLTKAVHIAVVTLAVSVISRRGFLPTQESQIVPASRPPGNIPANTAAASGPAQWSGSSRITVELNSLSAKRYDINRMAVQNDALAVPIDTIMSRYLHGKRMRVYGLFVVVAEFRADDSEVAAAAASSKKESMLRYFA
mmetsp:Transcript_38157/g.82964  ORF Transcript_38157/g.82964 Transcript_38157/m.82964 type:complete len:140 (-) Transcript_38157:269-688(-)